MKKSAVLAALLVVSLACTTTPTPRLAPCGDFYQYANDQWLRENPIPPDRSSWGTFLVLNRENREHLRKILDEAAQVNAPRGSNKQKLGDLWTTCMNEEAIEREGLAPIQPHLDRIDAIDDARDLQTYLAESYADGLPVPFGFFAESDFDNPDRNIAWLTQGGFGLPEPNYYTDDDPKSKELRGKYLQYVTRVFELLGNEPARATANAQHVMRIETALARASMTRVERRDPQAIFNYTNTSEVQALAPSIDWPAWFRAAGAPPLEKLNLAQPKFLPALDEQLRTTPIETWRTYLRFHLVNDTSSLLPKRFYDASFDFFGRALQGTKEQLPRWERCVNQADNVLGEALGELYVERHFPAEARARVLGMIENIVVALDQDIRELPWMTRPTKEQALLKLNRFAKKIGHPEKWIDYSTVQIDRGGYAANVIRAQRFLVRRDLGKIDKPIDRGEFGMTPPTVNAYNNPVWNEIVFTAGILQPPFFDPSADDAYNYGAIGSVIGHELIHGFDDQGRQFAADGSLTDWWTAEDAAKFEEAAECVEEQFASYDLGDGVRMDGKLVLGESIADLGGLKIALAAYQRSLQGKPRSIIDGLTPEQRFFVGYAREWAQNATPELIRLQVTTDPHPIPRYRVNGPLSNMPEFAAAYGCSAPSSMIRKNKCAVW